ERATCDDVTQPGAVRVTGQGPVDGRPERRRRRGGWLVPGSVPEPGLGVRLVPVGGIVGTDTHRRVGWLRPCDREAWPPDRQHVVREPWNASSRRGEAVQE